MFCVFSLFVVYVIINVAIEIKYQIEVSSELNVEKRDYRNLDVFKRALFQKRLLRWQSRHLY